MTSYNRQRVEGVSTKAQATAATTAVGHRGNSYIMQLNAMQHETWGYLRQQGAHQYVQVKQVQADWHWRFLAYLGLQGIPGTAGHAGTAGHT